VVSIFSPCGHHMEHPGSLQSAKTRMRQVPASAPRQPLRARFCSGKDRFVGPFLFSCRSELRVPRAPKEKPRWAPRAKPAKRKETDSQRISPRRRDFFAA